MKIFSVLLTLGAIFMTTLGACAEKNPILEMTIADNKGTVLGNLEIELYPSKAPKHVERITQLVKENFYNGLKFHRVIEGFMVQTGCPLGTGTGGSKYADLPAEFNGAKHVRGIVSMARAMDPNSANSQFFIMLDTAESLDGQYTVFGKVIKNLDLIDKIKKGNSAENGTVQNPSIIKEMKIK